MAKRSFEADVFSLQSIRELQRQLEKYSESLEYKARLLAERLAEQGVEIARMQIVDLDAIFTSELLNSIRSEYVSSEKGGAIFSVIADSDHAIFVEVGTGTVGARSPYHGNLPVMYAQGKTIRQLADGRYGWFYPGDDGNIYFTEGMPSRPFMFNTSMKLQKIIIKTAREIFG